MLGMKNLSIPVTGMSCGHCEARVVKALEQLPGVTRVVASHKDANVKVTLGKDATLDEATLRQAIRDVGYTPG